MQDYELCKWEQTQTTFKMRFKFLFPFSFNNRSYRISMWVLSLLDFLLRPKCNFKNYERNRAFIFGDEAAIGKRKLYYILREII